MRCRSLIVCARGQEEDLVNRHLSNWNQFFDFVILISPEDDPLRFSLKYGKSGHTGPDSIDRMRNAFQEAATFDCCMCAEADCVFFDYIDIQPDEVVTSEIHPNLDSRFNSPSYPHPPIGAQRRMWERITEAIEDHGHIDYGDRVLGEILNFEKIRVNPVGFSRNSIDRPQFLHDAIKAVKSGAKCIHGVKTRDVYEELMEHSKRLLSHSIK